MLHKLARATGRDSSEIPGEWPRVGHRPLVIGHDSFPNKHLRGIPAESKAISLAIPTLVSNSC